MSLKDLPPDAHFPHKTPYDYVIVGSGAGGGPLAARLALYGSKVLLIDAGTDPAIAQNGAPNSPERPVYAVPAFHAASTEDPEMSWGFSVRHYQFKDRQRHDSKYVEARDVANTGGIFYPRAAAIGGCTAHYAMIIIRPNDADWDQLAEFTGDDSWRSQNMQGYFPKIENCQYYAAYRKYLQQKLGWFYEGAAHLVRWIAPRSQLDPAGHGKEGWQKTSFISPLVIAGIVRKDRTFLGVLLDVLIATLTTHETAKEFWRAISGFQALQFLDPNVRSPDIPDRAHVSLISIGTDGEKRCGLRDHLLAVEKENPDTLSILDRAHVTRILFDKREGDAPRAIGVELHRGLHLYAASPKHDDNAEKPPAEQVFAKHEVIICGGAFNTPQLLMLSGIGDREELKGKVSGLMDCTGKTKIAEIVHLPGVGRNLQDRYEVSLISEMKKPFSTLKDVTFNPENAKDPALITWQRGGSGLYSTNGGALALMMSSEKNKQIRNDPDLFIFGVPAAFRGYYWDYSKQLLRASMTAPADSSNLWSWVILKAYTSNNQGTVRLRSADPFATPEINLHSFDDQAALPGVVQNSDDDVAALCDAIAHMRKINRKISAVKAEIQPGKVIEDYSLKLRDWIKQEAWGHHACGTCRMGRDPWRADVSALEDENAVVDSQFRVHGVTNLRIVDTSVFPKIPGYFIVTPTFMISEKAADLLIADSESYPLALERCEAEAILDRRRIVQPKSKADLNAPDTPSGVDPSRLPANTIGLALSGGGVRSATFCLGVLQALAEKSRLREVDLITSVSGGSYIGGFLGRLYTRLKPESLDAAADRIERTLKDLSSPEVQWLRQNAQYIIGGGRDDVRFDIAVILRNLAAVHLWIGALVFGLLGALHWFALDCPKYGYVTYICDAAPPDWLIGRLDVMLSPWWWLPIVLFLIGVLPPSIGYWLTMRRRPNHDWRSWLPFVLWLAMLGLAIYGLSLPGIEVWSAGAIGVLLLAWFQQQVAWWRIGKRTTSAAPLDPGTAQPEDGSIVVRNRLTRLLGTTVYGFVVSLVFVVLDTVAQFVPGHALHSTLWSMTGVAPALVLLRGVAATLLKRPAAKPSSPRQRGTSFAGGLAVQALLAMLAFTLVFVLLLLLDVLVYAVFTFDGRTARFLVVAALLISWVKGFALSFLNLSSLQQGYAQKLVRTYLGASNDARVNPPGINTPVPVAVSDLGDDIFFDAYHPEKAGGPLHLVCSCLNNTVDPVSGNQLRDDKGMQMCVGPAGISAGRRFHALWHTADGTSPTHADANASPRRVARITPIRVDPDPNAFHALARTDTLPVEVERLHLGQWMAISGAAATTGIGRSTKLAISLLLGLSNIRIGYWWDTGISAWKRPGRYPPNLWRTFKYIPGALFRLQSKLLDEWRACFEGPAARLWYLSDGGHFDDTAIYELIRRRVPFIVAVDATADADYRCGPLALLSRQVRFDFGATITWLDPTDMRAKCTGGPIGWHAFASAPTKPPLPQWIMDWLEPEAIGAFKALARNGVNGAALAIIEYANDPKRTSWLLFIKPSVGGVLPNDARTYAQNCADFPQQTTLDQFFDDDQWEAYRVLGQCIGTNVFRKRPEATT